MHPGAWYELDRTERPESMAIPRMGTRPAFPNDLYVKGGFHKDWMPGGEGSFSMQGLFISLELILTSPDHDRGS